MDHKAYTFIRLGELPYKQAANPTRNHTGMQLFKTKILIAEYPYKYQCIRLPYNQCVVDCLRVFVFLPGLVARVFFLTGGRINSR